MPEKVGGGGVCVCVCVCCVVVFLFCGGGGGGGFMPIFNPLLTTDWLCGIQQVQILRLPSLVSLHKRALKAVILLKNTTLAISDYNFLSIFPLEERLNYNKGVLVHKITAVPLIDWHCILLY